MLFLGELETGREVVSLGRTRALPVIEEVAASLADRAEHAEVRVQISGAPDLEVPLRPRMLRVVVENLVANAIRYSGPGSTCSITVSQEAARPVLVVSDDGAGVRQADLPRLFERFYRADRARSSRGTGLGLAIVKHVVTSAGGTVEARSAHRGAGSRSSVAFRRRSAARAGRPRRAARPTQGVPSDASASAAVHSRRRKPRRPSLLRIASTIASPPLRRVIVSMSAATSPAAGMVSSQAMRMLPAIPSERPKTAWRRRRRGRSR